jgi:protein TonB
VEAASLIHRVVPQYPEIARLTHVSGTIVLRAIIGKNGTVQELLYVLGPALLIKPAMDAVRQWSYRPTLLNGKPVEVETTIDVVFTLGS